MADQDVSPAGSADEKHFSNSQSDSGSLVSLEHSSSNESLPHHRRNRIQTALLLPEWLCKQKHGAAFDHQLESIIPSLDDFPPGYSKVAAVEGCDPNFLIYRKFSWLHNRVLLHHQDELVELEDELRRLDKFDLENDARKLISRRLDDAIKGSRRKELLQEIEKKLAVYHDSLLRIRQVEAIKRPTTRNQNSLINFILNTESLPQSEAEWILQDNDLAAVSINKEDNWFNGWLEDSLKKVSRRATTYLFRTKIQRTVSGTEHVGLLSRDRFNGVIYSIMAVLSTALLLLPVLILSKIRTHDHDQEYMILVIFLFTLTFSACCAIFTMAKKHEVFAATAAYSAVLVVFLGNTQNN
ncbi:hypothetical protein MMC24_004989 [Lignoscripta atroalba]|nr:hypothetical protein [Lignoscripta atroalba]